MDDRDDRAHARGPEAKDLIKICQALNTAGARYVLIGGLAVFAYGSDRNTKDIDLLIDDSPENVAKVKAALKILPDNAAAEVGDEDLRKYQVVRVVDEVIVDLMSRACGLSYQDLMSDAVNYELEGVEIPIASAASLIKTKQTSRPIDALDREFLESVLRKQHRE